MVRLVELRREIGALERQADLQQQVEPRVRDVAFRVPEGPVAQTFRSQPLTLVCTGPKIELVSTRL